MKAMRVAGVLLLPCLFLQDIAAKPSNIFYRVSPPNAPLKLEAVLYAPHFDYPITARNSIWNVLECSKFTSSRTVLLDP
jgi:hypothetical protein